MTHSVVGLARRENRYQSVMAALGSIADQVRLEGVRCVLIKPNFVSTTHQLATTHVDAIRAVLDFVRARYAGRIIIAEGAALSPTREGFHNLGYEPLAEKYAAGAGVELVDLNADEVVPVPIYNRRLQPMEVHLARTAVADGVYRISVCPPKTHDFVVATLSIKNVVMGMLVNPHVARQGNNTPGLLRRVAHLLPLQIRQSPLAEWVKGTILGRQGGSSKMAMHQGLQAMNLNLALVASRVWPHLAVIDGWQGMEGNGPGGGDPVDWRVALAGTDPLAVDALTAHLMGFDPGQIGYLQYCQQLGLGEAEIERIQVAGNLAPGAARCTFKPHPTYQRQLQWHLKEAERYLVRTA